MSGEIHTKVWYELQCRDVGYQYPIMDQWFVYGVYKFDQAFIMTELERHIQAEGKSPKKEWRAIKRTSIEEVL